MHQIIRSHELRQPSPAVARKTAFRQPHYDCQEQMDALKLVLYVPGVDAIVLNRGPGQAVDWREGNHGHVFSVFGTAADHDELRKVNDLITNLVHIDGE